MLSLLIGHVFHDHNDIDPVLAKKAVFSAEYKKQLSYDRRNRPYDP